MAKYEKVVGFEKRIIFRLTTEQAKQINKIIKRNDDLYSSVSHFVRAATIKQIRECDEVTK